jgi:hypothetical protein
MGHLAVWAFVPLVCFLGDPGLVVGMILVAASGAATSYQLAANAAFVAALPPDSRGQAFGLVQALMTVGQGACLLAAGALAQLWSASLVIAAAGCVGVLFAAWLAAASRHVPLVRT